MRVYSIAWTDRVERSVEILARSKEEAFSRWKAGDYHSDDICEDDCDTISEEHEIKDSIHSVKTKRERKS